MSSITGATKDQQTATAAGAMMREFLQGVQFKEMPNIITRSGLTTEVFRRDWALDDGKIEQIIHVTLRARSVSAWHCHEKQTDRIFVTGGTINLVLYDARDNSPTRGRLNAFRLSRYRPALVVIPPGIWHGLQNIEDDTSSFINFFDRAYCYEDPDEWRLPPDTDQIPYRFK